MKHAFRVLLLCITIIMFIFSSSIVYGARVHGTIYDTSLNPIRGVVVEVDSTPTQRHISRFGGYSFELDEGNYTITAYMTQGGITFEIAREYVIIMGSGDYNVDLFAESVSPESNSWIFYTIIAAIALLILAFVLLILKLFRLRKKLKQKDSSDSDIVKNDVAEIPSKNPDDFLKDKILTFLKESEGYMPQKDIRKKLSLSEAKVSQLLTDMESSLLVKKVKRGRVNTIVLK